MVGTVSGTTTYYNSGNPQSDKGQQLAGDVQDELIKYLGTSDRGIIMAQNIS